MAKYKVESKRLNIEIPISHIDQVKKVIQDYLSLQGLCIRPTKHKDIKPVNRYVNNGSSLLCPHCENQIEL